jgi:hypothetical protein
MRRKPYPLEAVRSKRKSQETTAKQEYTERMAEFAEARAEFGRAARVEQQQERTARAFSRGLRAPPEGCLAAELQRKNAYAAALREKSAALKKLRQKAEARCAEVGGRLEEARAGLRQAHADRKALERHREGFESGQKKARELEAELEAEDNIIARRGKAG